MKSFIIDGNNFSNLDGFFCEIDKLLTKNLDWKTGHNFNAFNDLLRGDFGAHSYEEPILLKWINYNKSKACLGNDIILQIIEIILDCNNSGHDCKLELY
ncbi:Barstar (barnase inhibitor) [Aminipila butyrica]|uniref:Barstar (Barnase inhibitor) n=1 Tax=Aminipila butyrica TaxID=433296 RepID=A0A858BTT4_9FIRM|nr:barstar family protein [Aminipila butyrica]QIB69431.1 Barstar (barnase inhibitor) [Aminipila butyrica]